MTLVSLLLLSLQAPASDSVAKGGNPAPNPDPRSRTIPELVCSGDRTVIVTHESMLPTSEATPLRLRLRGNLLYMGKSANTEKFIGIINRTDRRRWTADNATLILDETLQTGAWIRAQLVSTHITAIRCAPFDSLKR